MRTRVIEPLWTAEDVSEFLGVPVSTLYQWRYRRIGPRAARVGRQVLYVFAETFGPGTQEAMGWFDQQPIYGPVGTCDLEIDREPGYLVVPRADNAINAGLRAIGIRAEPGLDEYGTVGLTHAE